MGILDNFEAWVNFNDEEEKYAPPNPLWLEDLNLATKIFKEDVCGNCGCKNESVSTDILSSEDPR